MMHRIPQKQPWTPQEDRILLNIWPDKNRRYTLVRLLPGRTHEAMRYRYQKLTREKTHTKGD